MEKSKALSNALSQWLIQRGGGEFSPPKMRRSTQIDQNWFRNLKKSKALLKCIKPVADPEGREEYSPSKMRRLPSSSFQMYKQTKKEKTSTISKIIYPSTHKMEFWTHSYSDHDILCQNKPSIHVFKKKLLSRSDLFM